ncbi:hypothetical protein CDAR_531441 [Caerostris darwini]|uniref:Integrase zinc-binding domain-containing protein n=1 Tax=Caerostris darwini TaxID=1538125 RepID=A0AAV4QWY3_9ARAC|nr:hypothetical protein CDAR_531441 [Caerostris darwini]
MDLLINPPASRIQICLFKSKRAILLPRNYKISAMIIKEAHIANLHAGPTLLARILKQTYWIVGAKRLIRKIVNKCVCCRYHSKPVKQLMEICRRLVSRLDELLQTPVVISQDQSK